MPAFDNKVRLYDTYEDKATGRNLEHVYLVDSPSDKGSKQIYDLSVTTFVHSCFPAFDAESVINNSILGNRRWNTDPSYKYYRMSKEAIKASWKQKGSEASTLGTQMHATIESFYNHPTLWQCRDVLTLQKAINASTDQLTCNTPELNQFLDFHVNVALPWNLEPYRTELCVFDRNIRVAGSVDMLYKSPNFEASGGRALYMLDWKRSEEIDTTNKFRKFGNYPLQDLAATNHSKYCLQLNVYKRMIEENTDLYIEYMALGVFHPSAAGYKIYSVPPLPQHVDRLWVKRLAVLALPS